MSRRRPRLRQAREPVSADMLKAMLSQHPGRTLTRADARQLDQALADQVGCAIVYGCSISQLQTIHSLAHRMCVLASKSDSDLVSNLLGEWRQVTATLAFWLQRHRDRGRPTVLPSVHPESVPIAHPPERT